MKRRKQADAIYTAQAWAPADC